MEYSGYSNMVVSRRTYRDKCEWWQRTTVNGQITLSILAHNVAPNGTFRAKNVSNHYMGKTMEGDIRLSNGYVLVETPDDVSFLRPDDYVRYEGIFYRVDTIQRRELARTRMNMKHPICVFVIQLVR